VTPAHIVPEWYFLPFYAILRAIPDKLGGVIAMFAAIAVLAFLPWLDTSKVKSMTYRPVAKVMFWAFVFVCIILGWLGAMPAEEPYVTYSQIFTALYFGYFIGLFVIGLFEKPLAMPTSIADSVLSAMPGGSGSRMASATAAEPHAKG
jgi:ubiquinol-cytochrome c reductase cytochrome b/c1 subunit